VFRHTPQTFALLTSQSLLSLVPQYPLQDSFAATHFWCAHNRVPRSPEVLGPRRAIAYGVGLVSIYRSTAGIADITPATRSLVDHSCGVDQSCGERCPSQSVCCNHLTGTARSQLGRRSTRQHYRVTRSNRKHVGST